jgi:hypothetical protein
MGITVRHGPSARAIGGAIEGAAASRKREQRLGSAVSGIIRGATGEESVGGAIGSSIRDAQTIRRAQRSTAATAAAPPPGAVQNPNYVPPRPLQMPEEQWASMTPEQQKEIEHLNGFLTQLVNMEGISNAEKAKLIDQTHQKMYSTITSPALRKMPGNRGPNKKYHDPKLGGLWVNDSKGTPKQILTEQEYQAQKSGKVVMNQEQRYKFLAEFMKNNTVTNPETGEVSMPRPEVAFQAMRNFELALSGDIVKKPTPEDGARFSLRNMIGQGMQGGLDLLAGRGGQAPAPAPGQPSPAAPRPSLPGARPETPAAPKGQAQPPVESAVPATGGAPQAAPPPVEDISPKAVERLIQVGNMGPRAQPLREQAAKVNKMRQEQAEGKKVNLAELSKAYVELRKMLSRAKATAQASMQRMSAVDVGRQQRDIRALQALHSRGIPIGGQAR